MATGLLLRRDYKPVFEPYHIKVPKIRSGDTYYFTTESGLQYQVRFGKKRDNVLENIINLSVMSEEFEDEYSETNRGELFRIISTVIEIIRLYHENHLHSVSYEFTGEFKETRDTQPASIRSRLYYRYASRCLNEGWEPILEENKVMIRRGKP
jgi:hypothetical protein